MSDHLSAEHLHLDEDAQLVLAVRKLTASYRSHPPVVRDLDLRITEGRVLVLLGPSGCGKTTTLRSVAGLHRPTPTGGSIKIGERMVFDASRRIDVPTNKRRLGMVFQSYALWPHMTVLQNVEFPLLSDRGNRRGMRRDGVRHKALESIEAVGLQRHAKSLPGMLSGGQQQRLALARALVADPALLLLDEPLSNLDAKLRVELRKWIRSTITAVGATALYVTHDHEEALGLGDEVAVMADGRIVELDTPEGLYRHPRTLLAAQALGRANEIVGTVAELTPDSAIVKGVWGQLACFYDHGLTPRRGESVHVMFRPGNTSFVDRLTDGPMLSGKLVSRTFLGETVEYELLLDGSIVLIRQGSDCCKANIGDPVSFVVSEAILVSEHRGANTQDQQASLSPPETPAERAEPSKAER